MAKKKTTRKVNMSKVRGLCYLVLSVWLVIYVISQFNTSITSQTQEIADLNAQKAEYEQEEEELTEELESLDNEEYLLRYAREHYVFTEEDETAVKISGNSDE